MRALEFLKGHVFYNPAYNKISQTKETMDKLFLVHAKKGERLRTEVLTRM